MSGDTLSALGEQLSRAFAEIDAELEATDGEFTDEMQRRLDAAEIPWEDKVLRTGRYARSILYDVAEIKGERKRLAARARALLKKRRWLLNEYLPYAMKVQGRDEVRSALATVKLGLGRESVECDLDPAFIDPDWVRSRREVWLDKKKVLAENKAGRPLPDGVRVVQKPTAKVS
jgi:hypothetical protein